MSIENPFGSGKPKVPEDRQQTPSLKSIAERLESLRTKIQPTEQESNSEQPEVSTDQLVNEIVEMTEGTIRHNERMNNERGFPGGGLAEIERREHSENMNEFEKLDDAKREVNKLLQEVEQMRFGAQMEEANTLKQELEEQKRTIEAKLQANSVRFGQSFGKLEDANLRARYFVDDQDSISRDPLTFAVDQVIAAHHVAGQDFSGQREQLLRRAETNLKLRQQQENRS